MKYFYKKRNYNTNNIRNVKKDKKIALFEEQITTMY